MRDHGGARRRKLSGVGTEAQRAFFEKQVAPWMGRLFADMEKGSERQILPDRLARSAAYFWKSRLKPYVRQPIKRCWSGRNAMKNEKKVTVGRRDFLRKVGVGAVGAGATLATPLIAPAEADSETTMRAQGALQGNR